MENLKLALNFIDVGIEECTYSECKDWVVLHFGIFNGIQCDECKGYFCKNHVSRTFSEENKESLKIKKNDIIYQKDK